MAFVNKQSGDEAQQERAASGEPYDFDPNDPDVVKVHYDVSGWNFDQRAELSEALAEAELPHVWEGDEVIIPDFSFPATANVVAQQGATPVFVDISLHDFGMNPDLVEAAITAHNRPPGAS